jgi:hypothetical protein
MKLAIRILSVILLLFLYLLPNIGLSISKHFCGGELSSISAFPFHDHDCGCGDEAMDNDCCKDEFSFLKLEDSQQKTQQVQISFEEFNSQFACHFEIESLFYLLPKRVITSCIDPPDYGLRQCLYKKYQSLLI